MQQRATTGPLLPLHSDAISEPTGGHIHHLSDLFTVVDSPIGRLYVVEDGQQHTAPPYQVLYD